MEPQDEVQYCPYRTSAGYGEVNTADYSNVRYYEFSESENDNQQNYEGEGPHGQRATQQPPPTLTSSSKKAKKKSKKARAPSPLPSPPNDALAPTQDIVDPDEEWGSPPKSKKKSKKTQQTPAPALPVEEPTAPEPTTIDAEEEPMSTTKSKKKKDKKKSKAGKEKDSDTVEEKVVIAPPAAEVPDEQVVEEETSTPKTKAQKAKDKKEKKDKKKDKKKSKGKNDDAEHEADTADKSLSAPAPEPSSLPDAEAISEAAEPSPSASPAGDDDAKAADDEPAATPAVMEEVVTDAPVTDEAPSHSPSVPANETVEADKEPSVEEAANDEATAAPENSSAVDDKAALGPSETPARVAAAVSEEPAPPAEAALAQEQEPSPEALVVEEAKTDDPAAPVDDHSSPKPSEEPAASELVAEVASNDTAPPAAEAGTEPNTEPAVEPALESAVELAHEAAVEPPAEPPAEPAAEPTVEPASESAAGEEAAVLISEATPSDVSSPTKSDETATAAGDEQSTEAATASSGDSIVFINKVDGGKSEADENEAPSPDLGSSADVDEPAPSPSNSSQKSSLIEVHTDTSSDGTPIEFKQQASDGEPPQVPPAALASEPLPDDNLADEDTLVQSPEANMSDVAEIGLSGQMTELPDEGVLDKTLEVPLEVAEPVPADKEEPELGASSTKTDTDAGEVRGTSTTKANALDGQNTQNQENPADKESVTADETQPIELADVAPDVSLPEELESELETSENPAAVVTEATLADKASLTDDTVPSKDVGDNEVVETPAASRDEVEKDFQSTEQGNKIEEIATPLAVESQAQDLVPAMNNDISDEDLALYGITSDGKQLSCTESILAQNAETTLAALTSESTESTEADLEPETVEPIAGAAEILDRGDEASKSEETTSEPQSVSVAAAGVAATDVMADAGVTANTPATAEGDSESPPISATNRDVPVEENPSSDAPVIVEEAASMEAESAASHAGAAPEIASEPAEEDPEPTASVLEPGPVDKPDEDPDSDTKAELGKGEKTADPDAPESSALVEERVPPETSSAEATAKTTEVDLAADSELSNEETTAVLDAKNSVEPLEVGLEPVPDLACTEQPASPSQATELENSSAETKPEVEDEKNATKESEPDSKVVGEPRPDVVEEREITPSIEHGSELSGCELELTNEESAAVAVSQPTEAADYSQPSTENTQIDIPGESAVTLSTEDESEQSKQSEAETTTQVLGADTSSEEPEPEGVEPGEPEAPTAMSEVVSETPDAADEPKPKTSIEELNGSGLSEEITPESVEKTEPGPSKTEITTTELAEASEKEPPTEAPIAAACLEAKELATEPTDTGGQATSPAEASGDVESVKPSDDQAEPEPAEAAPAVVEQGSEPATIHPSSEPEVSSSDDSKAADAATVDLVPESAPSEVPQPTNGAESTSNDIAQEPEVDVMVDATSAVEPPEAAVEDEKPASEPEAQTAAPDESEDVQAIEEESSSQGDSSAQPKAEVVEEDSAETPKDTEAVTQEDKTATEVTEDAPEPGVPPKEPDNGEPIDTASTPGDAAPVAEPEVSTVVSPQGTEEPTVNTGSVEPPEGVVPSPEAAAPQEETTKEPQVGETADPTDAAPPTPPPEVDEDKNAEAEESKDSVGLIIGSEQTKSQPKIGEAHLHFLDHDAPDGSVRNLVEGPASGINGEDVRDGIAHNLLTPAGGNVSGQSVPELLAGQELAVIPALDAAVGESNVVIGRVGHVETNTLGDEQSSPVIAAGPETSESFPGESVDLPQTPVRLDIGYEVDCTTTDLATDGPKGSTDASESEEPDIVTTTVDDRKLDILQDGDQPLAESDLTSVKERPLEIGSDLGSQQNDKCSDPFLAKPMSSFGNGAEGHNLDRAISQTLDEAQLQSSDQLGSQYQTSTGAGPESDVSTEAAAEEVAISTVQLSGSPIPVARVDTIAIEDIETEQDASSSMGRESGLQRNGESATEIFPSEEPAPKFAVFAEENDHAHNDDAESVEKHHQSLVDEETLANTGDGTQWPASDLADTLAVAPSSVDEPMVDVSSTLKATEENSPSLVNEDLPISEAGLLSEPVVSVVDDAQSPRNPKEHLLVLPTNTEDNIDAAARLEDVNVPEEINKMGKSERHTYPEVEALPDDSGSLELPLEESKQMAGDVEINSVFHNLATAAAVTAGAAGLVASAPVFCNDQPSREQTLETSTIAHRASSDKLTQTLFDQPISMSGESSERQNADEVVDTLQMTTEKQTLLMIVKDVAGTDPLTTPPINPATTPAAADLKTRVRMAVAAATHTTRVHPTAGIALMPNASMTVNVTESVRVDRLRTPIPRRHRELLNVRIAASLQKALRLPAPPADGIALSAHPKNKPPTKEERRSGEYANVPKRNRREERRERTPEEQAAHERRKEERRAAREKERELERGEERRREKEKERSRSSAVKESKGKEPEIDTSSPAERAHHHRRVRRHSTSVPKDEGPASAPATVSNKKFFDIKNAEGGVGLGFQSPSSHAKPATPEQAPTVTFEEASPSSREVPKRSSTTRSRHGHGHKSRTEDLSKLARARDAVAEEAREAKEAKEAREARRAARRAREETAPSEEGSSTKGEDSRRRAREEERKRTRDRDIEKEKEKEKNGFRAAFKRLFTS
ncbi:hypothetical protein HYQ44_007305 [Verticillium longisporum]|nr:hypothetical protein HYQ44_007305 [Verticillium longisporum]